MNKLKDLKLVTSREIYSNPLYKISRFQLLGLVNKGEFPTHADLGRNFVFLEDEVKEFFKLRA